MVQKCRGLRVVQRSKGDPVVQGSRLAQWLNGGPVVQGSKDDPGV